MANASRTERRKAERNRRKAVRQIPPEVKERIAQIQRGEKPAPLPDVDAVASEQAPPTQAEAAPSPEADLPPGMPTDLPPEIAGLIASAQAASGGDGAASPPPGRVAGATVGKARSKRFTDLEKELAILLTLPGPLFEGGGDAYCAAHFMIQGPLLANRLVAYAETNPATAQLLERIVAAGGFAVVAMAIFSYALPPMMHHGLPAPEGLRKMYHVPEKHVHTEEENGRSGAEPKEEG
jgi:hypothetical protein